MENPVPPPLPPVDLAAPVESPVAGFWRRVAAVLIDSCLLGTAGFLLGLCFAQTFMHWGGWARLVGFAIALVYLVPLNSRLGGGQTLGKRVLGLRVTTASGVVLGLGRSLLRTIILASPFFLNNAPFPLRLLQGPLGVALSVVIFGMGISIVYLFVCNRRTRQSLHDLVVGSYVVRAGAEGMAKPEMWRGHYVVVGLILLLSAALPLVGKRLVQKTGTLKEIMPAYEAVTAEPEVTAAQVMAGQNYFWDSTKGKRVTSSVTAVVRLNRSIADQKAEAEKMASIILRLYPAAGQRDLLNVTLVEGFDLGIASGWSSKVFAHSPADWRAEIGAAAAPEATSAASPAPSARLGVALYPFRLGIVRERGGSIAGSGRACREVNACVAHRATAAGDESKVVDTARLTGWGTA